MLTRLRDGGARFVVERPQVRDIVDELLGGGPGVVEALLVEDRSEPTSLAAMSSWLAPAGACFVGSARLDDDELGRPLSELLADTEDDELREQLRDIAERPVYRIDLFRRGEVLLDEATRRSLLLDLELVDLAGRERRTVRRLLDDGVDPADARRDACGRRWRRGSPTRRRSCRRTRPRRGRIGSTSASPASAPASGSTARSAPPLGGDAR